MLSPKLSCNVKRELLRDYIAAIAILKAARRDHADTLATGADDRVVLRSSQRVKEVKAQCGVARMRFAEHRHNHQC